MADTLCQFFSWAVRDVIFFSGDVQTTTIAVAMASSLCCSIVVAIVHVMALILPSPPRGEKTSWRSNKTGTTPGTPSLKKGDSMWLSSGRVHVPCVKCGKYFADDGCRFVTCQSCCFSMLLCHVHQRKSLTCKPCDSKQTEIDLSAVGMQSCPERLGFVGAQLTCLNLADNQLSELPPEIGCLRGLERLSLKHNHLSSLPVTLGTLTRLHSLDISNNKLQDVPECVLSLQQLQELQLSQNQLCQLTPDISKLRQLTYLDISYNKVEVLSQEMFSLIQLEYLSVKSNPLAGLPCAIGNLVKLHTLDLGDCGLHTLPPSIGKCSNMAYLSLDNNKLHQLPCQLGQLIRLRLLRFTNNRLQFLPAMLAFLLDTVSVYVEGNPLLHKDNYSKFTHCPSPSQSCCPSLKELSARQITRRNIPNTHILPTVLQDLLRAVEFCSECGGPMFTVYSSQIIPRQLQFGSAGCVPLYRQLCSPHKQDQDH